MKDEERTERIMDWLEKRLSMEEALAFEEEMAGDADLAAECGLLSGLIACLGDMDGDLEPSAGFHHSLMTRLSLENGLTEGKQVNIEMDGQDESKEPGGEARQEKNGNLIQTEEAGRENPPAKGKKRNKESAFRDLMGLFRRRPIIPGAAVVCCLIIVIVVASLGRGGSSSPMGRPANSSSYSNSGGSVGSVGAPPPPALAPSSPPAPNGGMYDYIVEAETQYSMKAEADVLLSESYEVPALESIREEYGSTASAADQGAAAVAGGGLDQAQGDLSPSIQKIIRSGNIRLEVEHFNEAVASIKALTAALDGYVTAENSYVTVYGDGRERKYGNVSIKVPFNRYDQLFEQAQSLGKVLDSSVWADDVTAQYVDLQARIGVYTTKYQRLMALLDQSGDLETILKIENELASTNAELESYKGQMRYLLSRTDYSTLEINLSERDIGSVEIRTIAFGNRVSESFVLGVNGVIRSFGNLIVWLAGNITGLAVFALVLWLIWLVGFRRWRKRRRERGEQ